MNPFWSVQPSLSLLWYSFALVFILHKVLHNPSGSHYEMTINKKLQTLLTKYKFFVFSDWLEGGTLLNNF